MSVYHRFEFRQFPGLGTYAYLPRHWYSQTDYWFSGCEFRPDPGLFVLDNNFLDVYFQEVLDWERSL